MCAASSLILALRSAFITSLIALQLLTIHIDAVIAVLVLRDLTKITVKRDSNIITYELALVAKLVRA